MRGPLKSDLLAHESVGCALSKQARRGSLWHNHVGKSRPKYYPELKLTPIACLRYPANAIKEHLVEMFQIVSVTFHTPFLSLRG